MVFSIVEKFLPHASHGIVFSLRVLCPLHIMLSCIVEKNLAREWKFVCAAIPASRAKVLSRTVEKIWWVIFSFFISLSTIASKQIYSHLWLRDRMRFVFD